MATHTDEGIEEDDFTIQDDYYTFLNVARDAPPEEITNAYRRLSKLYHPDKHPDPVRKKDAEVLFNRTRKAYEVLNDPHKRAIYDTLGIKGLETEGWQIIQRTKTPQEIREEYERLAREQEERRLQQRTNPKGTISVGIDATDMFMPYDDDMERGLFPHMEISSMTISQSIDAPLNLNDTATLSGSLSTQNGTGHGAIACTLRHVLNASTWSEFELGAGNGLILSAKAFRTISKRSFITAQGMCRVTPTDIRPGLSVVVARQLGKQTLGYLTWKGGLQSFMNTTVVWDSNSGHLVGSIQFGIPNTYAMMSYTYKFADEGKLKGTIKAGTLGIQVEYGCEKKISQHSILGASVIINLQTGVTLKIRVNRANQNYVFPILLADEPLPSAIFYGTIAPMVGWLLLNKLIIQPYHEKQKQRETQKVKEANASKLAEKRKEAASAVALMTETYTRIREIEEVRGGLIIMQALYGNLGSRNETGDEVSVKEVVDVTIPLQCLVKDSHLIVTDSSKSNLPGFYDPCIGEDKSLLVKYKFRNLDHEVIITDNESLRIPKESHLVRTR